MKCERCKIKEATEIYWWDVKNREHLCEDCLKKIDAEVNKRIREFIKRVVFGR